MLTVVGITGGIGSGKTSAARCFVELGSYVINADYIAHIILKQSNVIQQIADKYGDCILDEQGQIDRKKLGEIVFSKKEEIEYLNSITHPLIRERLERDIQHYKDDCNGILIVELPLLFECSLQYLVDKIIVVDAPIEVRIGRIVERDKICPCSAFNRIQSQMSSEERCKLADIVIMNDSDNEVLKARCAEVWNQLIGEQE